MEKDRTDLEPRAPDAFLNAEQQEAVTWGNGPLVVFAGAGSGKTRVITSRIVHLIRDRGVHPSRIVGLTFTNRAASEMRERVTGQIAAGTRPPFLGTFHAFCARLLRMHGQDVGLAPEFSILDEQDQISVIKEVVRSMELDPAKNAPRSIRSAIERAKREGGIKAAFEGRTSPDRLAVLSKIMHTYEDRLRRLNGLDFADLILRAAALLESGSESAVRLIERTEHVLVDEFQDTDRMQARLITLMAPPPDSSVCVVGDDDQSIYRWRGADVRNILDFRKSYPFAHVVKLERNYRSTANILDTALAVISKNTERAQKTLWTDAGPGEPIVRFDASTERDEARFVAGRIASLAEADVPLDQQAVLYRVHAQSRAIEEALRERDLPYRIVGGVRFYDRAEIRDMLAYLRLAINPDDDVALTRIINRPPRGLGEKAIETLRETARRDGSSMLAAAAQVARGGSLTAKARDSLGSLAAAVKRHNEMCARGEKPGDIIESVIEDSGYMDALESSSEPEAAARILNVRELVVAVREFETEDPSGGLLALMERIALSSSVDDGPDQGKAVVLMTVHAAKGLEFDSVVVTGLEEGLFPLPPFGSEVEPDAATVREELHEERRLFYVAVTRARRRLALTWSRSRRIFGGGSRFRSPSPFLEAIPARLLARVPSEWSSRPSDPGPDTERSGLGMRVRHARFGVGIVVRVEEGLKTKLVIKFADGKIRKIIDEFVSPA